MENTGTEIWKPLIGVEGVEGQFMISNHGRVKRIVFNARTKKEYKALTKNSKGYYHISFSIKGKNKTVRFHRLVAFAFVPNPHRYKEINHIDGNKANNRADNLAWCTRSENNRHKYQVLGYTNKGKHSWSEEERAEISARLKAYYAAHPRKKAKPNT